MKTWMFWVVILVFVFVIVPLIYFGITASTVKSISSDVDTTTGDSIKNFGPSGKVITLQPTI